MALIKLFTLCLDFVFGFEGHCDLSIDWDIEKSLSIPLIRPNTVIIRDTLIDRSGSRGRKTFWPAQAI